MTANWHYGETLYVKLYWQGPDKAVHWLGWLGNAGVESDWAAPVSGDEDAAPPTEAAKVQWAFDAQKGNATDAESYKKALAGTPRYLTSEGRVLDGTAGDGFKLYWTSASLDSTKNYALTEKISDADDNLVTISRVSSTDAPGSLVHTYDNYSELAYYKYGPEVPVLFGFVPTTDLDQATHPNWISDRNAVIGDRPLPKIVIPGSHDAGAYQISRGGGEMTSRTQQFDITSQLLAGSRFLDLRTDLYDDGVWYIRHGKDWTDVRFDHVIEQLGSFLDTHPKEFVLVELLVSDTKGKDGMKGACKDAWQMLFDRVHAHHLNYTDENGVKTDINTVTPNTLKNDGKNLLLFGWGESRSWYFDINTISGEFIRYSTKNSPTLGPNEARILVSPWESKPEGESPEGDVADLEGAYLDGDFSLYSAKDILDKYDEYERTGGLWNLQTNLPWQFANWTVTIRDKHLLVTPDLVGYMDDGRIARRKANIINIDYLADTVVYDDESYDLVTEVIKLNDNRSGDSGGS